MMPRSFPSIRLRAARAIALTTPVAVPCLFSFHFVSFMDVKLAALALVVVVLVVLLPGESVPSTFRRARFAPLTAVLLLAVILATARYLIDFIVPGSEVPGANTLVPEYTLATACSLAVVIAAAGLMWSAWHGENQGRLLDALALSGVLVSVLGLLQYAGFLPWLFPKVEGYDQRAYSVFGNQDLFGGYLAITGSLLLAQTFTAQIRPGPAWPAAAIVFAGLLVSGSRTAWLAAAAGGTLAFIMHRPPRKQAATVAGGALALIALGVAFAPGATLERVRGTFLEHDVGYRIRLWIWDAAARMIADQPWFGVGLGNFQYHSPRYLADALHARGPGVHLYNAIHTTHAHSDHLELLSETGIVGAMLVALFFVRLPRTVSPAWPPLAAGLAFSLANTTLHSPPHILAMLLCAAVLPDPVAAGAADVPARRRWIGPSLALAALALAVGTGVYVLAPSFLVLRAEEAYQAGDYAAAERDYVAVVRLPGPCYEACYALGVMRANDGRFDDAAIFAECALRGLDTMQAHLLAGHVAEALNNRRRAIAEYEAAVLRTPAYAHGAWEGWLRLVDDADRDGIVELARKWQAPDGQVDAFAATRERLRVRNRPEPPPAPPTPPADATTH